MKYTDTKKKARSICFIPKQISVKSFQKEWKIDLGYERNNSPNNFIQRVPPFFMFMILHCLFKSCHSILSVSLDFDAFRYVRNLGILRLLSCGI